MIGDAGRGATVGCVGAGSSGTGGGERSMIRAVVFDLDGVLVDSEPVWEEVRRGLVAERGSRRRTAAGTGSRASHRPDGRSLHRAATAAARRGGGGAPDGRALAA